MISREFRIAIEKWVKVETWHTDHPLDDERFYKLLAVAESEGAHSFDVEGFVDVASELAKRHHPEMQHEFLSNSVLEKGLQAEAIMGYIAYCSRKQV